METFKLMLILWRFEVIPILSRWLSILKQKRTQSQQDIYARASLEFTFLHNPTVMDWILMNHNNLEN